MRLFSEIAAVVGRGDGARVQYTVIDGKGGYFQNVRRMTEFSSERIVFAGKKGAVQVEGEGLSLGKYFAGDAAVKGNVKRVERIG